METFTDQKARQWRLSINSATIERVRQEIGVDLLTYGMQHETEDARDVLQFQVRANPILLTRIVFCLVRRQAEDLAVDFEAFAEDLTGTFLWDCIGPLETEIINFTPNPDQRAAIGAAVRKMASLMDKTHSMARQQTERAIADPRIDALHDRELRKLAEHSGKMLDSLESEILTRIPTAS
jgi:hypothetical protein